MHELVDPFNDDLRSTFFMKDIYDEGLAAVKDVPLHKYDRDSLSIVKGYTILDEADDADGKPKRDYYLWTGLVRLLISAGDICHAGVKVRVSRDWAERGPLRQWSFFYEFDGVEHLFMTVYPTALTADESVPAFEHKSMGGIDKKSYMAKLGAYPLLVNPSLARRSTAALNFIAVQYLSEAGLRVDASWHPDDTSKYFARYHMTDGVDHYLIDYAGPVLLSALAFIDKTSGRTEEDGAIVMDEPVGILDDYQLPSEPAAHHATSETPGYIAHHNLPTSTDTAL